MCNSLRALLLTPVRAAREEDDEHAEEERDKSDQQTPNSRAEGSMVTAAIFVDVVVKYAEDGEVDCQ